MNGSVGRICRSFLVAGRVFRNAAGGGLRLSQRGRIWAMVIVLLVVVGHEKIGRRGGNCTRDHPVKPGMLLLHYAPMAPDLTAPGAGKTQNSNLGNGPAVRCEIGGSAGPVELANTSGAVKIWTAAAKRSVDAALVVANPVRTTNNTDRKKDGHNDVTK